jgi:hypothetical protein
MDRFRHQSRSDATGFSMSRQRALAVAALAVAALVGSGLAAKAEPPAALVEDVQGKVTGAEFMDYVVPGQVIKIGQTGSIVLSYLRSCRRETISGIGTVIVGAEESKIHLSDIKDEKVDCDAGHAHATTKETSEAAATVFRSITPAIASTSAQVTLYGASPIFEIKGRGPLIVERIDKAGERHQIEIGTNRIKGRFLDFAKTNRALAPGGTYAATFGTSKIVFRIDPAAKPGAAPVLGRLLQMD